MIAHVALVSLSRSVGTADLVRVAAAIQKQVLRDFGPIWNVQASVDAFGSLLSVPLGYWPVIVLDQIDDPSALGYHQDLLGQPYALVKVTSSWELTASHEVLEMLADPFGNRLVAGPSPRAAQGRVNFLVEVCDPSESGAFSYTSNGVPVSDFYTPHYFDPVVNAAVRYSYTGAVKAPRTVLRGGYLSWVVPQTGHMWQLQWLGATQQIVDRGPANLAAGSLRAHSDRITPRKEVSEGIPKSNRRLAAARSVAKKTETSTSARAKHLLAELEQLGVRTG